VSSLYPPPAPTVSKTRLLADFITGLGWDVTQETGYPLLPGPEIQVSPDRIVTLTPSGGPGYVTEEAALDAWAFQARLRGPANDPDAAELAAQQFDWYVLTARTPQPVDGVTISNIGRLGAPPSPLPLDPADRRFEFTCTYVITTGGG
jgi:hypothetical protein